MKKSLLTTLYITLLIICVFMIKMEIMEINYPILIVAFITIPITLYLKFRKKQL